MNDIQYLQMMLHQAGHRSDTAYTAILARQLEYAKAQTYDIMYPELKSKKLLPVSYEISRGAETWKYEQWDHFGMANVIANYADDVPMVGVLKDEFIHNIIALSDGFDYSIQDLYAAEFSGVAINTRKASAARRVMENKMDDIASSGYMISGLPGCLNHPNVPLVSPSTGTWSTASGANIVIDMNLLANTVIANCLETFYPDTYVMDSTNFQLISSKPYNSAAGSETVLEVFLRNHPYVKNVEGWLKCNTADVAGTGARHFCYKKDPSVLTLEIPLEFEQLPPQVRNLAFIVNCHARIAGVAMYYPLAAGYMDGC